MTLPLRILFLFLPVRLSSLRDSFTNSLINFVHLPISYYLSSAFPSLFVSLRFHISHTRTRQRTQSQVTISSTHSELKVQQTEPPITIISTPPFTFTIDNYTPSHRTATQLQLCFKMTMIQPMCTKYRCYRIHQKICYWLYRYHFLFATEP
jgi:septin family protein